MFFCLCTCIHHRLGYIIGFCQQSLTNIWYDDMIWFFAHIDAIANRIEKSNHQGAVYCRAKFVKGAVVTNEQPVYRTLCRLTVNTTPVAPDTRCRLPSSDGRSLALYLLLPQQTTDVTWQTKRSIKSPIVAAHEADTRWWIAAAGSRHRNTRTTQHNGS